MKLGTILLRDAVINLSQLEAGLRAQVLYGGRLGTNLVELGHLDVDTLGLYLARILEVPVATKERFRTASREVLRRFGKELAERHTAFPLGFELDTPDRLAVALPAPRDEDAIAALSRDCGYPVVPYAAAELRILYYLEQHYEIVRKARYLREGDLLPRAQVGEERRRRRAAAGLEMPGVVRFEPKRRSAGGAAGPVGEPEISYLDACTAIDAAEHREVIGQALVDFAVGRFAAAAALLVRGKGAVGWHAYSPGRADAGEAVAELGLPLGGTSVLQAAHDSGRPYRGGPLAAGRPVERRLWDALAVEGEPEEMLVVPVLVRKRVVNLFYAHPVPGGRISDQHANELAELAIRASDAYVRLIHAAKTKTEER